MFGNLFLRLLKHHIILILISVFNHLDTHDSLFEISPISWFTHILRSELFMILRKISRQATMRVPIPSELEWYYDLC